MTCRQAWILTLVRDGNHLERRSKAEDRSARALYMERPSFFLDEATSALDEKF